MASSPHNLALYARAVQSPWATAALLERMHRRAQRERSPGRAVRVGQASKRAGNTPALLREDFAGSCALAAAWVAGGENHRALCVDNHAPTLRWAERYVREAAGERSEDVHLVCADVMDVGPGDVRAGSAKTRLASTTSRGTRCDARIIAPRVDVIAALNFSALIFHDRDAMLRYLRHARANLGPGGVFVMDVFSAPHGSNRTMQARRIPAGEGLPAFVYRWEQRAFDAETRRIDCRIHFGLRAGARATRASAASRTMRWRRNAFRYDWTLWPPETLVMLMREAGFSRANIWCDRVSRSTGLSDGVFRPVKAIGKRKDFFAYVVGAR